ADGPCRPPSSGAPPTSPAQSPRRALRDALHTDRYPTPVSPENPETRVTRVAHPDPKNHDAYYEQEKRILDAWLGITGSEFGI
ncbi:MAG TPA: hypothetical protein VHW26_01075, partial [Solirubrobacteraceae bacterium]|nr:hypothetical protein [Solirubrobacteraceae bacterium]